MEVEEIIVGELRLKEPSSGDKGRWATKVRGIILVNEVERTIVG